MSSPSTHHSSRRRASVDGQGVLGASPVRPAELQAASPAHIVHEWAMSPPPSSPLPAPPIVGAVEASLLGNLSIHRRRSVSTTATPSPAALMSHELTAPSTTTSNLLSSSPPLPSSHASSAQQIEVSPHQPAAAPHDVISAPSATHVDDGAHSANCAAAKEMPVVSSLSLSASIPANQLAAAAAAEIHVILRDANLADVAVTGACVATKEGIDMLSIATRCGETDNIVDSLQSQAHSTAIFASAATTSSQASHTCSSQQVNAAAPVPTVRPGVEGHGAKAEDEESHRLLFKAKAEAQHIKQMRMRGEAAAHETIATAALDHPSSHSTSYAQSAHSTPLSAEPHECKCSQHVSEQLVIMERTLREERASSQGQIEHLQRQLQASTLLHRTCVEEHSRLSREHRESLELIINLQKEIEDSKNARASHQAQTSDLIAGVSLSLDTRMQELQNQVLVLAAGSDKQKRDAALASCELQSLRALVALASDHAQAAMRAKAKDSGEPMHRYLWERSCGWYVKDSSGEQQGPLDMCVLSSSATKHITSCWCEGFDKWLPFERAMGILRLASPGIAGKYDAGLDVVQYHVAQVCFLHSRASDVLERLLGSLCTDTTPAAEPAAGASVESSEKHEQQPPGYPSEVLESMWLTVSKRSP